MSIVILVVILTGFVYLLALPTFEGVFALLLTTPILALLFGQITELNIWIYLVSLLAIAGSLHVARRFWLHERRDRSCVGRVAGQELINELLPIIVFLIIFLFVYALCKSWPDFFATGERLRDYALLSSVLQSPVILHEPWFDGYPLNYYAYWYRFGHFLKATLGLETWQVYNQLQAFTFALYVASAFRILQRYLRVNTWYALAFAILIGFGSNIAGMRSFFLSDDNWWGPSRVIPGAINEFPAWSLLLGDVHPHYLNLTLMPFLLCVALAALPCAWTTAERLILGAGFLVLAGFWTYNANAWEIPVLLAATAAIGTALLIQRFIGARSFGSNLQSGRDENLQPALKGVGRAAAIILCLFAVLIGALWLAQRNIVPADFPWSFVTDPIARTKSVDMAWHFGMPLTLIALSSTVLAPNLAVRLFAASVFVASLYFSTALPLLLVLMILCVWRAVERVRAVRAAGATLSWNILMIEALGIAALIVLVAPELIFLNDPYGGEVERMNTIFKFYSADWLLLHMYGFYLAVEAARMLQQSGRFGTRSKNVFTLLQILLAIYLLGFFARTTTLRRSQPAITSPAEQGLSQMEREFKGAAATIQQLRTMSRGRVLEAQGPAYANTSHVSVLSEQPSYLGWANHVQLLNRQYAEVTRREEITERFYTAESCDTRNEIMHVERIRYAVVGPLERRKYPDIDSRNFSCLIRIINEGEYSVYVPASSK